jgi:hypothetical protein
MDNIKGLDGWWANENTLRVDEEVYQLLVAKLCKLGRQLQITSWKQRFVSRPTPPAWLLANNV